MKIILTILLLGSTLNLKAGLNYFEGRIIYTLQYYDSYGKELNADSLGLDKESHYFISDGNYKSLNEKGEMNQLYNSSTNNYYSINHQGQIQQIYASIEYPEIIHIGDFKEIKNILGYVCKKITVKTEISTKTYFYAEELKINKDLYQNHNYGNWNLFLNFSQGSLFLKNEILFSNSGMILIMKAQDIKKIDLSVEDFDIDSYIDK
ncbi:MAG: hypothetical protein Kapaf2KO_14720 [Candidatus Kapaibacteriales bacterium]